MKRFDQIPEELKELFNQKVEKMNFHRSSFLRL